jgi:predicted flap endonuclease-1-like 5' DNA nuclease
VAELERRLEGALRAAAQRDSLEEQLASLRMQHAQLEGSAEQLLEARDRVHDLEQRLSEAESRAAVMAEAAPSEGAPSEALQRALWRVRYLEARARHLETERVQQAAEPAEALQRQGWRLRYLQARVQHLEGVAGAAAVSAEAAMHGPEQVAQEEQQQRQAWRLRYLDRRMHWIIERSRAAVTGADAESDSLREQVALAKAHAAALEAQVGDMQRLRWRAEYLERRVKQLEERARLVAAEAPAPRLAPVSPQVSPHGSAPSAPPPQAPAPASVAPPVDVQEPPPAPAAASAAAAPAPAPRAEGRPLRLASPRNGAPDDLRLIAGVTPQIESKLHASGVYHFDQIAAWTPAQAAWMDAYLSLRGQVARDGWVRQCAALARGERPAVAAEPA